jgi:DNA-binding NtrC family response regulator
VVEDDMAVCELALSILQAEGYRVLGASNGNDVLRVAQNAPCQIDLLITDVVMPHMGGSELAEKLRSRAPHLKVIYMSGYTDDASVHEGFENDKTPFQLKPFSPTALVETFAKSSTMRSRTFEVTSPVSSRVGHRPNASPTEERGGLVVQPTIVFEVEGTKAYDY